MTAKPDLRPWALGAAALVVAGIAAALITGGGGADRSGVKLLAAADGTVRGIHYRVVASTPNTQGPKRGPVPLQFDLYTGKDLKDRLLVPGVSFYRDSVIATFKVAANPNGSAGLSFSWFHHAGDQTAEKKHYRLTQQGIQLY